MGKLNSDEEYILPNDASEAERLDFQHVLLCKEFGGLFRAPLERKEVRRVLDLGCGSGIWSIDCAREYPDAEVIGLDLTDWVTWKDLPSNCSLRKANIEAPAIWETLERDFDLIHIRFLAVSIRNWPALLKQLFSHLRPGGWFEAQELALGVISEGGLTSKNSILMEWSEKFCDSLIQAGLTPDPVQPLLPHLKDAGLVNIRVDLFKMILGPWPEDERGRELGRMGRDNVRLGMRGFTERLFTAILGWTKEQYDEFIEKALVAMDDPELRGYVPMKLCTAQRPAVA